MDMTFRWFGAHDPIPLEHVRQIPGVRGVVTALYDVECDVNDLTNGAIRDARCGRHVGRLGQLWRPFPCRDPFQPVGRDSAGRAVHARVRGEEATEHADCCD
jgi:hypothetical protein